MTLPRLLFRPLLVCLTAQALHRSNLLSGCAELALLEICIFVSLREFAVEAVQMLHVT
jgi:hypothetical protein